MAAQHFLWTMDDRNDLFESTFTRWRSGGAGVNGPIDSMETWSFGAGAATGTNVGADAVEGQGTVVSQADRSLGSDIARAEFGLDGAGIKVGIISDSFDFRHQMADDLAHQELPQGLTILRDGFGADEGRAMAQIVHDIAPGADILFASVYSSVDTSGPTPTGIGNLETFADAIYELAAAGAKIIVDDWYFTREPTYYASPVTKAIHDVTAMGVTVVTAAGNNANQGYEARFDGSAGAVTIGSNTVILHQFAPGQDYLPVTVGANGRVDVTLHWDDPSLRFDDQGHAQTHGDLDVLVYDAQDRLIFVAANDSLGTEPVEDFFLTTGDEASTYHVKIALREGTVEPERLKLVAFNRSGASLAFGDQTVRDNDGAIFGHSANAGAISVGAADYRQTPAYGAQSPIAEQFSSVGPATVTFDSDGHRLAAPQILQAITLTAPQNGDTTFFGTDTDGNGLPNFRGTSAAAPATAALAALMLEANADLSPQDISHLLQSSAIDMDNRRTAGFDIGPDSGTGAGLVQATAVAFAATGTIDNSLAHNPVLLGTHLDDLFIGGTGRQTISGFGGHDVFRGSITDFADDRITDFGYDDRITMVGGDANSLSLSYDATTHQLSYTSFGLPSRSMTVDLEESGHFVAVANSLGGVDIQLHPWDVA